MSFDITIYEEKITIEEDRQADKLLRTALDGDRTVDTSGSDQIKHKYCRT